MKKVILITTLLIFSLTACSTLVESTGQVPTPILEYETAVPVNPTPITSEESAIQPEAMDTEETVQESEQVTSGDTERVRTFTVVPGESSISYEVGEVFINQGNVFNVAVGVTDLVSGEIQIDTSNPQNSRIGTISVDISKFTSDSNRRDNAIRGNWLESNAYPIATFTPTKIEGIPVTGEEGVSYALTITGDMTIRDITKEVTFEATVKVEDEVLSGTAETMLLMSDYDIGPIDIIGILKTEDEVKLTFNLVARESPGLD
jgi:polyisoprenoid-binding protein YceI